MVYKRDIMVIKPRIKFATNIRFSQSISAKHGRTSVEETTNKIYKSDGKTFYVKFICF